MRRFCYSCRRWLYTSWRFHVFIGAACVVASLFWAWHANKAEYFNRSGSIMVLVGGFMTFRHYLRGADNPFLRDTGFANQSAFGIANPMEAKMKARREDSAATGWGIGYLIVGTIIWGYGDLLLKVFRVCDR